MTKTTDAARRRLAGKNFDCDFRDLRESSANQAMRDRHSRNNLRRRAGGQRQRLEQRPFDLLLD